MHRVIEGLKFTAVPGFLCYSGSTAALLEAGHLRPHQVPGLNGNPATCASFHPDGTRVKKGARHATRALGYVKVQRMRGDTLRVMRCIEEITLPADEPKVRRLAPSAPRQVEHWPFPVIVGGLPS